MIKSLLNNKLTFVESSDSQKKLNSSDLNEYYSKNQDFRWNVNNIYFFDFFYENKSAIIEEVIVHIEKNIIYRNVHIFINKIEKMIKVKDLNVLQINLSICLRD